MRSRNSTTVTSAPRRRHTEPSSRPMTPAPTTISFFGGAVRLRAPVEDTTIFSSISTPGKRATSEPLAMTITLASSAVSLPSAPLTITLPGAAMRPSPVTVSILFFLKRKATPLTLAATLSSLCFIIAARSSFGAPKTTPRAPRPCAASSNISEACRSAFEGMQPMLRHVPPSVLRFSTTATFIPSWAARIAQT